MTDEQKDLIEIMIQKHKENNGKIQWKPYRVDVFNGDFSKEEVVYHLMINIGFTKVISDDRRDTLLLPEGYKFKGFKEQELTIAKENKRKKWREWPQNNWLSIMIMNAAISALVGGIIGYYIGKIDNKSDSNENPQKQMPKRTQRK